MTTPSSSLKTIHLAGAVVSTAIRFSTFAEYHKRLLCEREDRHDISAYDQEETSYSFCLPGDTELLLMWQDNPAYPTDCTIEYELIPKKNRLGLELSYLGYRGRSDYRGIESPRKSLRGIMDNQNNTSRAVLLHFTGFREELTGLIVNPPYPLIIDPLGHGGEEGFHPVSAVEKYLPLLVGVAVGLALGPVVRAVGQALRKPRR